MDLRSDLSRTPALFDVDDRQEPDLKSPSLQSSKTPKFSSQSGRVSPPKIQLLKNKPSFSIYRHLNPDLGSDLGLDMGGSSRWLGHLGGSATEPPRGGSVSHLGGLAFAEPPRSGLVFGRDLQVFISSSVFRFCGLSELHR